MAKRAVVGFIEAGSDRCSGSQRFLTTRTEW
ncbi:hypothetical protein COLO4_27806 [Corchorus olitorius]|uniref:Uncharacterized protein n=1 Tax=Corchorus olitorius TaxID=93759 RepID=A0A1R3HP82_9ROSI|nr:hypothetical protein COLO4_27806 [Corchorus olitorius]